MTLGDLKRLLLRESASMVTDREELKKQLSEVTRQETPEAKWLYSFLFEGKWKEDVNVPSDLRLVLSSYKRNRVRSSRVFRRFPDIVFSVNFLTPWVEESYGSKIDWSSALTSLKSVGELLEIELFRFQAVLSDDPRHKELVSAAREQRVPDVEFVVPRKSHLSFAKSVRGANYFGKANAAVGFTYKMRVLPLFDVESFSNALIDACVAVVGHVPPVFYSLEKLGKHEEEVLAPQDEKKLVFGEDVVGIKAHGLFYDAKDILEGKVKLVDLVVARGRNLVGEPHVRVLEETIPELVKELIEKVALARDKKFEHMGGMRFKHYHRGASFYGESDLIAYVVPLRSGDKREPTLSDLAGFDVFVYEW